MNFQGRLNTPQLTSMLQFLSNDCKTGVLRITRGQDKVNLCLNEGMIVYATGNIKGCFLGTFLKKKGIISDDQLKNCIDMARREDVSIGKILVNKGYISVEKLGAIVHAQVEEILLNLLLWGSADFSYQDTPIDTQKIILVEINFIKLILNASRRIDEISFIKRLIPNNGIVFRISENNAEKQALNLDANEWRILRLINSQNTVGHLIQKSNYDPYAVYKVLYSFLSAGIIEACMPEGPTEPVNNEIYDTILINYLDTLNTVFKFLKDELGQMAYTIMEQGRSGIDSPLQELFKDYQPERPTGRDVQRIKQYLDAYEEKDTGYRLLITYMDRYLSAIIGQAGNLLGGKLTSALVDCIRRVAQACDEQADFHLKGEMLASMERIMDQAPKGSNPTKEKKPHASGIVSILKAMVFPSPNPSA